MKFFTVLILCYCMVSITSAEEASQTTEVQKSEKGVDVDGAACRWNKSADELEECKSSDPDKKKIGERLDSRLKQDAKKIKSFFGIKTKKEREEENSEIKSE